MAYKDRKSRKLFVETWKGRGYEKGETQQFWLSLLTNVLGYEHNDTVLFEHHTSTGGFIDVWIRQSDVMIEQKGIEIDLDKEEPRQGVMKTPLQQVQDYAASLPITEQPKYLMTCNFETFRVYDRTKFGDAELKDNAFEFQLEDLVEHPEYLSCIVDPNNSRLRKEKEVSEQAGALVGELYDMLLKQYFDPESEETKHSLNVLCVRLVFCLFCEDAGLFRAPDAFCTYLAKADPSDIRIKLQHLFDNLDKSDDNRDKYDTDIKVFPYVNGGLFREKIEIPPFTQEIKDFLIEKMALPVNWSNISPTIFGGIFESTLNPETRRKGGMHYTSPENIHKVIDPLFLNDLKAEFDDIRTNEELSVIQKRNRYRKFHEKLCSLVFFDPACGSGNFLTETFISLKKLEFAVLRECKRISNQNLQMSMFDSSVEGEIEQRIRLNQFYGIEINDFAVAVAETALWISSLKANLEYVLLLDVVDQGLPLTDRANIICENALRFDWHNLIEPANVSYIMGNPPFVGSQLMDKDQKEDVLRIFKNNKHAGELDYVACWYAMATEFVKGTNIEVALVSTNSICQGEQVAALWKDIFAQGIHINFAYRTFNWISDSLDAAGVHCVIVGFSLNNHINKYIFDEDGIQHTASNINAYLIEGDNILIESRSKPLCSVPSITKGCQPTDGGNLIIEADELEDFLNKEPNARKYIKKLIGAKEFTSGTYRYCLWLVDATLQEIQSMPLVTERIARVREMRLNSSDKGTQKLAERAHLFRETYNPDSFIVVPSATTKRRDYVPLGFMHGDVISTNLNLIIPDATLLHFAVLTSNVHMAWMRVVCGRLREHYRYSKNIVYNNFPWPTPTDEQKVIIEQTAQGILDARALYSDKSLADLYDPDKMPAELKAAHEANDKAVMDAYGFSNDMTEPEIVAELMKMYQELTEKAN